MEKATLEAQMGDWFSDRGLHIAAMRGYPSQTLIDKISDQNYDVILYAGDFDPTGEDIVRDVEDRLNSHTDVIRVALTAEQVDSYGLPPAPGKTTDTRAGRFMATHGVLVQVELEALDPNDLRQLFEDALEPYWDVSAFEEIVDQETREREELTA